MFSSSYASVCARSVRSGEGLFRSDGHNLGISREFKFLPRGRRDEVRGSAGPSSHYIDGHKCTYPLKSRLRSVSSERVEGTS